MEARRVGGELLGKTETPYSQKLLAPPSQMECSRIVVFETRKAGRFIVRQFLHDMVITKWEIMQMIIITASTTAQRQLT